MNNPEQDQLMHQAAVCLENGQLDQALALYTQVCALDQPPADAWMTLGAIHAELGNLKAATQSLQKALQLEPDYSEAHFTLGHVLHAQGENSKAMACFRQAVHFDPDYAEAHFTLGQMIVAFEERTAAIPCFQEAVRCDDTHAAAWLMLGWSLLQAGNTNEALPAYLRAAELDPTNPATHFEIGNLQKSAGNLEEAVLSYHRALQRQPNYPEASNNLGATYQAQGNTQAAIEAYHTALKSKPDFLQAQTNLADMLQTEGRADEAIPYYENAIRAKPDMARAHYTLGRAYQDIGMPERAFECYRKCLELAETDFVKIRMATVLPVIMASTEEINIVRERFSRNLDELLNNPPLSIMRQDSAIIDPSKEVDNTNFYLAYHGMNDIELQRKMAQVYESFTPSLLYESPHIKHPGTPRKSSRISIGFVSRFFNSHTIGTVMKGLIAQLSRELFSVTVFGMPSTKDNNREFIENHCDNLIELPIDLVEARELITQQQLDILFYTDIGMDPFTYYLAFSRLAPVQCTTWGHPVTTGLRNIDYYISCSHFEPEGAQEHYTEKLVCLGSPPTFYYRPQPPKPLTHDHFGLDKNRHIYLCPQTLFKFHPDFDDYLANILRADPNGVVVILECKYRHWADLILDRLRKTIPDVFHRIVLLPYPGPSDYVSLIQLADVMLDTIHYGGGNTSLQALGIGRPIVTQPGNYQRGRHTYAYYKMMGYLDCVAKDRSDYVRIAVKLGTDPDYRNKVRLKILESNSVLFENSTVISELESFFSGAVNIQYSDDQ